MPTGGKIEGANHESSCREQGFRQEYAPNLFSDCQTSIASHDAGRRMQHTISILCQGNKPSICIKKYFSVARHIFLSSPKELYTDPEIF